MHVHDSIVSEGEKLMGYLLDRPQCQAYILHVHSMWKVRGSTSGCGHAVNISEAFDPDSPHHLE